MTSEGYCLRSPNGRLIAETFSIDKAESWSKAFKWLYSRTKWMKRPNLWKKWDLSISTAKSKGYVIVVVELSKRTSKRKK